MTNEIRIALPADQFGTEATTALLLKAFPEATLKGKTPGGWAIPGGRATTTCRAVYVRMRSPKALEAAAAKFNA